MAKLPDLKRDEVFDEAKAYFGKNFSLPDKKILQDIDDAMDVGANAYGVLQSNQNWWDKNQDAARGFIHMVARKRRVEGVK